MKKFISGFLFRGLPVFGFGPIVLAIVFLILQKQGVVEVLTATQVCIGIVSTSVLAFIAGGINIIYQIEQIPLMIAILIQGIVLYISYLVTYLVNSWLEWGIVPIIVFTCIFIFIYFAIWVIIYSAIRKKTKRLNEILIQKQKQTEE